jgi:carboxyl-terminal processing protease
MVAGLDPHSQYFDKKSFKEFRESTGGKFVGIGIEMGMEDGLVKVVSPIEGSPAFRAGLKPGDLITRIDDTPVKGLTVDQAVKRMRGDPNTKVVLTVFRKSESRTFPVTIMREEIRMQSVRAKMVEPGYGWLRVSQFQDRTVDDFVRKVEELYKQDPNLKGLVLDLRNDPGGLLDGAVALSAAFLPADVVVVSTNGQIAESRATFRATPEFYARRGGSDPLRRLPAALKNGAAGGAGQRRLGLGQRDRRRRAAGPQARHHHGRADLRQGLGADRAPAAADTALKITTARYYTPSAAASRPRASCPTSGSTKPPRATSSPRCACARPTSTSTCSGRREEGRGTREGARGSAQEARGAAGQEQGTAQAAARVRHARGLPAAAGAEPAAWPAGDGQQDRRQERKAEGAGKP